jgi:hypothetical protein
MSDCLRPSFVLINPEQTYTLPPFQTPAAWQTDLACDGTLVYRDCGHVLVMRLLSGDPLHDHAWNG